MNNIRRLADLFIEIKNLESKLHCPCLHRDMFNRILEKMMVLFREVDEIINEMGLDRVQLQKRLQIVFAE